MAGRKKAEKEFYCRKRCLGGKFLKQKVKLIRKQKAWNCWLWLKQAAFETGLRRTVGGIECEIILNLKCKLREVLLPNDSKGRAGRKSD